MYSNKDDIYYKKLYFKYKTKYLKLKQIGGSIQCEDGLKIKDFSELIDEQNYRYLGRNRDRKNTIVKYIGSNKFQYVSGDNSFNGTGTLNSVDLLCKIPELPPSLPPRPPKTKDTNYGIKINSLTQKDIETEYKYLGRDYNRTNTIVQLKSLITNKSGIFEIIFTGTDQPISTKTINIVDPEDPTKFILSKKQIMPTPISPPNLIVECESNKNSFTNSIGTCSLYGSFMLIILTNAVAQHALQNPESILDSFSNTYLLQYLPKYLIENSTKLQLTQASKTIINELFQILKKRLNRLVNLNLYTDLVCETDLVENIRKLLLLNKKTLVFGTNAVSFLILLILSIFLCNTVYKSEEYIYPRLHLKLNDNVFFKKINKCTGITILISNSTQGMHNMVFYKCNNVLKFCDNSIIIDFNWIIFFEKIFGLSNNGIEYEIYYNFTQMLLGNNEYVKTFKIIYKQPNNEDFIMIVFNGLTFNEKIITSTEYDKIKTEEFIVCSFNLITLYDYGQQNALEQFKLMHRMLLYNSNWFDYTPIKHSVKKNNNNSFTMNINNNIFNIEDCIKYYELKYGYRYGKITSFITNLFIQHYNPITLEFEKNAVMVTFSENTLHLVEKIICPQFK